jgi:hypothetical protein
MCCSACLVPFSRWYMHLVQRRCSRWNLTATDWTLASLPTTTCTEHSMQKKRSFASVGIGHLVQRDAARFWCRSARCGAVSGAHAYGPAKPVFVEDVPYSSQRELRPDTGSAATVSYVKLAYPPGQAAHAGDAQLTKRDFQRTGQSSDQSGEHRRTAVGELHVSPALVPP